jgi:3-hydroxybutyryl-CoA dehydrogenase
MPEIRRVAVLGCGLMGSGIAEISAKAGYETWVREVNDQAAARGRSLIEKSLGRAVDKGKLEAAARDEIMGRIRMTTSLQDLKDCDIIIEAVTEDLELKNGMFRELDGVCRADAIFASNTSSLTVADMAAATSRPGRFIGLHFFNPVPVMKLVEVVRTIAVDQDTFDRSYAFAKSLGKEPVEAKDTSGFIVNRLLVPYMLDAIRCLEQGLASTEDIDRGMTLGTGYPMGPFTLSDFVGIDTLYYIAEIMFEEFREPRFAPPPLLKRMVTLGMYGRKTKKGFYDYSGEKPVAVDLGI